MSNAINFQCPDCGRPGVSGEICEYCGTEYANQQQPAATERTHPTPPVALAFNESIQFREGSLSAFCFKITETGQQASHNLVVDEVRVAIPEFKTRSLAKRLQKSPGNKGLEVSLNVLPELPGNPIYSDVFIAVRQSQQLQWYTGSVSWKCHPRTELPNHHVNVSIGNIEARQASDQSLRILDGMRIDGKKPESDFQDDPRKLPEWHEIELSPIETARVPSDNSPRVPLAPITLIAEDGLRVHLCSARSMIFGRIPGIHPDPFVPDVHLFRWSSCGRIHTRRTLGISPGHFTVEANENGIRVRDGASGSNGRWIPSDTGTFLNGERVDAGGINLTGESSYLLSLGSPDLANPRAFPMNLGICRSDTNDGSLSRVAGFWIRWRTGDDALLLSAWDSIDLSDFPELETNAALRVESDQFTLAEGAVTTDLLEGTKAEIAEREWKVERSAKGFLASPSDSTPEAQTRL